MLSINQIFLVFLSALTVILADAVIKKTSLGTILSTLKSPLMVLVYLLYFTQIIFAIYIFKDKGGLAIYANYFIIFYSILGVIFGILFFKENLRWIQFIGVALALIGAILINYAH